MDEAGDEGEGQDDEGEVEDVRDEPKFAQKIFKTDIKFEIEEDPEGP